VERPTGDTYYFDWNSTLSHVLSNRTAWEAFNLEQYGFGVSKDCNCSIRPVCEMMWRYVLVTNYDDVNGVVLDSLDAQTNNCSNSEHILPEDYATVDDGFDLLVDYCETSIANGCSDPNNTIEFCYGRSLWLYGWDETFHYPAAVYFDSNTDNFRFYGVTCLSSLTANGSLDETWTDSDGNNYCSNSDEVELLVADWLDYTIDSDESAAVSVGIGATWCMMMMRVALFLFDHVL